MARPRYPIMLDVTGRLIVVIGGGKVAARKVAGLIRAGAEHVRIIAPELRGTFESANGIEHFAEHYHPANLDEADLVFAATDDANVNDAVVRDAHERGLFVCRADSDDDTPGDFITPAAFVEGNVHVSVSAGSAALSAAIRDGVQRNWRSGWTRMAEFMRTHRPLLVAMKGLTGPQRRAIFQTLASDDAIQQLETGGPDGLTNWLQQRHPEINHV